MVRTQCDGAEFLETGFMNSSDPFSELRAMLQGMAYQTPVIIVCIVGLIFVFVRKAEAPKAALWAGLGFGLALLVSLLIPISQQAVWHVMRASNNYREHATLSAVLGAVWSLMRAATYVLLLAAIFAGRKSSAPSA